jgi:hypothetical protein
MLGELLPRAPDTCGRIHLMAPHLDPYSIAVLKFMGGGCYVVVATNTVKTPLPQLLLHRWE